MANLTLTTFDWVPPPPRGFVRDLRVRWALEEAALSYRVASVPFDDRGAAHLAHQPFGQVPWLTDGDISIFETGAILLHLGERSDALLPADPKARSDAREWLFAALNSVEAASLPWSILVFTALNSVEMASLPWAMSKFMGHPTDTPAWKFVDDFLKLRLKHLEPVLAALEWLTGSFSVADILMADVLRPANGFDGLVDHPACRAYLARATARPAFAKARSDQMAHFAAADATR